MGGEMNGHVTVPGGVLARRPGESDVELGARADRARREGRERALREGDAWAPREHIRRFLLCFDGPVG